MTDFKNKNFIIQEYDAFNFLDDYVLNLLKNRKKISNQEIIKQAKKNLTADEPTINTCLSLMYVNGFVSTRFVGAQKFYKITRAGTLFLKKYSKIINQMCILNQTETPTIISQ
jgi:DNA-binding PadR family transcriptional regulator